MPGGLRHHDGELHAPSGLRESQIRSTKAKTEIVNLAMNFPWKKRKQMTSRAF